LVWLKTCVVHHSVDVSKFPCNCFLWSFVLDENIHKHWMLNAWHQWNWSLSLSPLSIGTLKTLLDLWTFDIYIYIYKSSCMLFYSDWCVVLKLESCVKYVCLFIRFANTYFNILVASTSYCQIINICWEF